MLSKSKRVYLIKEKMMQEIICVLDQSGSMNTVADDAMGGFNKFLEEQKKIGEANITIVFFDTNWELHYTGLLSACKPLEFWPVRGGTSLFDAIGKTINHVKERFTIEKPEKVIMAILTDGHENSSVEFNEKSVGALIKDHQDNYAWDVIFLAADQDAWATARHLNIKQDKSYSFSKGAMGQTVSNVYSSAVSRSRSS
jgi:Mg-chelatase subunit ChlD